MKFPAVVFAAEPNFDTPPSIVVDLATEVVDFEVVRELMYANWEQPAYRLRIPYLHRFPLLRQWAARIPSEVQPEDMWVQVDGLALVEWTVANLYNRLLSDVLATIRHSRAPVRPTRGFNHIGDSDEERDRFIRDDVLHLRNVSAGERRDAVAASVRDGVGWMFDEASEVIGPAGSVSALSAEIYTIIRMLPWQVGSAAGGPRIALARARLYEAARVDGGEARRWESGAPEDHPDDDTLRAPWTTTRVDVPYACRMDELMPIGAVTRTVWTHPAQSSPPPRKR